MIFEKPKFWNSLNLFSLLLLPLSLITSIFNFLKSILIKEIHFKIPIICVGNIFIGGTGKTSLCIKINKILNKRKIKSCFIKKFYKNQVDEQKLLENNGKLESLQAGRNLLS